MHLPQICVVLLPDRATGDKNRWSYEKADISRSGISSRRINYGICQHKWEFKFTDRYQRP